MHPHIRDADKEKRKNMVKDNGLVLEVTGANIEETIKNNPRAYSGLLGTLVWTLPNDVPCY